MLLDVYDRHLQAVAAAAAPPVPPAAPAPRASTAPPRRDPRVRGAPDKLRYYLED